jgi:hypothetical protein
MKKKVRIIVDILFNAWEKSEQVFRKDWIEQRISIFMKYTLKSLKAQTNQDFVTIVRYHKDTRNLIQNALAKYAPLPQNVRFVSSNEYTRGIIENIKGYDVLYLVRLDSDDMYHKTFIQKLHDYKPKADTEVLICQKGYIYDSVKNRIAEYFHISPQFYTFIYDVKDYINGKRYRLPSSHYDAIKMKHEILEGNNYVNLVHSNNTLFTFEDSINKIVGEVITDKTRIGSILKNFM